MLYLWKIEIYNENKIGPRIEPCGTTLCLNVFFSSQWRVHMTSSLQDLVLKPVDTTWALQYGKVISYHGGYILMLLRASAWQDEMRFFCVRLWLIHSRNSSIELYFAQIWPLKTVPSSKVCLAAVTKSVPLKITLLQDVALWVRMHTSSKPGHSVLWEPGTGCLELTLKLYFSFDANAYSMHTCKHTAF